MARLRGGDRVYNEKDKRRILKLYNDLSLKYGIKFFNADNLIDKNYGCGDECCGTEFLRNHKIWGGCYRSLIFDKNKENYSSEFGKCYVNFTRSTKNANKTIEEVSKEYNEKENKRLADLEHSENNKQLSLFD